MSEENDEPIFIEGRQQGGYCVTFDPLDGSSNIDCAVRWAHVLSEENKLKHQSISLPVYLVLP